MRKSMRSSTFNVPNEIEKQFSKQVSLKLFEKMCLVRYFERGVVDIIKQNGITYQVYLSTGQEAVAAAPK